MEWLSHQGDDVKALFPPFTVLPFMAGRRLQELRSFQHNNQGSKMQERESKEEESRDVCFFSHYTHSPSLSLLPPFPYKRRKSSQLTSAAYPQFHLHQWVRGHRLTITGNGELDGSSTAGEGEKR